MEKHIVAFYFFADEALKASRLFDNPQAKMTNAEIITPVLTAANFFYGNQRKAARFLKTYRYIPNFLSESHSNRRLHRIPLVIWQKLFSLLAEYFKNKHSSNEYVVDSFPVSVCDNIRVFKSKIISGEQYRGYIANKSDFFMDYVSTSSLQPIKSP